MNIIRSVSEGLARTTSRRGLFGRGAQLAAGALIGVAAGSVGQAGRAGASLDTICLPPGPMCPCNDCQASGVCAKPCTFLVTYASGCWVDYNTKLRTSVTCCDCLCPDVTFPPSGSCGCASDYHNNPVLCP